MIPPQRDDDDAVFSARSDRLSRAIHEHIAKGNKPDFEFGQEKLRELSALVSTLEPWRLTDEQFESLVVELCGRRNILRDWPVVRLDDDEEEAGRVKVVPVR